MRLPTAILLVLVLVLSVLACAPAKPAASPSSAGLKVTPPEIILNKSKELVVEGSGFAPGSMVSIGFPDLLHGIKRGKMDFPDVKELWIGAIQADQTGAFSFKLDLANLWAVVRARVVTADELSTPQTIAAKDGNGNIVATATVTIKQAEK
jgi:hypothetical protein